LNYASFFRVPVELIIEKLKGLEKKKKEKKTRMARILVLVVGSHYEKKTGANKKAFFWVIH